MTNTFQGHFPDKNTTEDGYVGIAPVEVFPSTARALRHGRKCLAVASDWYRHDYYQTLATQGICRKRNPQGPEDSVDPASRV